MRSLGDSIRVAVVPGAPDSPLAAHAVTPTALPDIWRNGEAARDRFRALVPGLLRFDPDCSVVGVCSALGGEGTTTVAAGLACALAEAHVRIAIVDAQRIRPAQHGGTWRASSARTEAEREPLLGRIEILPLRPAGDQAPPGDLRRVIADACHTARVVVVDLEPLRESAQALDLGGVVHAVSLAVEAERERREVIARSVQTLTRAGVAVAGVLLNKRPLHIPEFLYRWL